jgi:tRNA-specific adenosine deaminase 2
MTPTPADVAFMEMALEEARRGLKAGEVPVGCVVVSAEGQVLARGHNLTNVKCNATRHAELEAVDFLLGQSLNKGLSATGPGGPSADPTLSSLSCPPLPAFLSESLNQPPALGPESLFTLAGCTLYVTVEPCVMCASALARLKISRVFFGCANPRFGGNGTVFPINRVNEPDLGHFSYPSEGGLLAAEAIQILKDFYEQENPRTQDTSKCGARLLGKKEKRVKEDNEGERLV